VPQEGGGVQMSARLKLKKIHNLLNGALKLSSEAETNLLLLKRKIFNNTIVITSIAELELYACEKGGNKYIEYIAEKIAYGIAREYTKYLAEYIKANISIDDARHKPFDRIRINLKAQRLNEDSVTIERDTRF
jgi:hypothetical protein